MDIDKSLEDLIIFKQYGIKGYSNGSLDDQDASSRQGQEEDSLSGKTAF